MFNWLKRQIVKREISTIINGTLRYLTGISGQLGKMFNNLQSTYLDIWEAKEWEHAIDDVAEFVIKHQDDIEKIARGVQNILNDLSQLKEKQSIKNLTEQLNKIGEEYAEKQETVVEEISKEAEEFQNTIANTIETLTEETDEDNNN